MVFQAAQMIFNREMRERTPKISAGQFEKAKRATGIRLARC
jgi:hypothetical protein